MFGDYGKELLRSGIIDAKSGHRESARRYLDRAVYISNDHDVLAEAWFWMSEVLDDKAEKRKALENCLAHDLQHARARRSRAVLDGRLKADEIIDPDKLPLAPAGLRLAPDAARVVEGQHPTGAVSPTACGIRGSEAGSMSRVCTCGT